MTLKVLVCVKRVVDPNVRVSVRPDRKGMQLEGLRFVLNPFDEVAVEEAVSLRESGQAGEVVALSVGTEACRDVLRTALAMGADRALLLNVPGEPEPLAAAKCLAAVIRREQPDLVLMGKQSTDHDYGLTPAMLAGVLGWPQALQASRIQVAGHALEVTCELDKGVESVSVPLPAVISADLRLNTPRFASLPAVMKAKRKPIETLSVRDVGLPESLQRRLEVLAVEAPPARSAARILPDVDALIVALREEARVL